jgi:hypothetical protein
VWRSRPIRRRLSPRPPPSPAPRRRCGKTQLLCPARNHAELSAAGTTSCATTTRKSRTEERAMIHSAIARTGRGNVRIQEASMPPPDANPHGATDDRPFRGTDGRPGGRSLRGTEALGGTEWLARPRTDGPSTAPMAPPRHRSPPPHRSPARGTAAARHGPSATRAGGGRPSPPMSLARALESADFRGPAPRAGGGRLSPPMSLARALESADFRGPATTPRRRPAVTLQCHQRVLLNRQISRGPAPHATPAADRHPQRHLARALESADFPGAGRSTTAEATDG